MRPPRPSLPASEHRPNPTHLSPRNEAGVKQVATAGQEEKCTFTLVPSISAGGDLLPMQSIFIGKTTGSCPSPDAPGYDEVVKLGYKMLPSKTSTYWSTEATMEKLVDNIITPYFDCMKEELGLPKNQCSIWKINCWSVHKSKEFQSWLKKNHPTIIVIFIPGCCTGLWQPLDVGIQHVMKLSVCRSAHRDMVIEVSDQIANGVPNIKLDNTIGTLCDCSMGWIVKAIHEIGKKELIMKVRTYLARFHIFNAATPKAFELCRCDRVNLPRPRDPW